MTLSSLVVNDVYYCSYSKLPTNFNHTCATLTSKSVISATYSTRWVIYVLKNCGTCVYEYASPYVAGDARVELARGVLNIHLAFISVSTILYSTITIIISTLWGSHICCFEAILRIYLSEIRDSNSHHNLGRVRCYHYNNFALCGEWETRTLTSLSRMTS